MKNTPYSTYNDDVLSGKQKAGQHIICACRRFREWQTRTDVYFNAEKVQQVINFISKLRHFTGTHNNKPFILQPWQQWIIANIFGWYWTATNQRVTKNVYIEIARKNGKSAFASAICLYCLIADNEANAEVELIANSRKQAGICFNMCSNFIQTLTSNKSKYFKLYRDKIDFKPTKSFLQVLSSDANNNDGWNSSAFVCDEYHSHNNSQMYDVMKSSQGMRQQPLAIVITTAGFNLFSPCYEMRQTNIEIIQGKKQDDTQFSAIYSLDEDDDWTDEENWIKANPNLNVTVRTQYLKEQVQQAKNNTSMEVSVRTKNFNQWLTASAVWIPQQTILECCQPVKIEDFKGEYCYCGIDLASVGDLTAVSVMIPNNDKYYFKTYYYLPAETAKHNHQYIEWGKKGFLTITDGNVADYEYILKDIIRINSTLYINQISYDQWNATQWAIQATNMSLPIVPYSQALWNFNKPTKELERLILSGKVVIDDNPITRWCFSNCVLKFDHNENCKPVKEQNQNKIDGVIAMIEALGIYLEQPNYNNSIIAI